MAALDQRVRDLAARLGLRIGYIAAAGFNNVTGRPIRLIVLHDMEYPERPDGAEWCANFFASGRVRASAHYCVDNDSAVQGVDVEDVAWAAPGANHDGVQVEQAGFAAQSREQWLDPYSRAEMANTAKLVAALCVALEVGARHLTVAQILAGQRGIVAHRDVNAACHRSDHSDMGPNYPWDVLLPQVQAHIDTLTRPTPTPPPPQEDDMAMTPDERTALAKEIGREVALALLDSPIGAGSDDAPASVGWGLYRIQSELMRIRGIIQQAVSKP